MKSQRHDSKIDRDPGVACGGDCSLKGEAGALVMCIYGVCNARLSPLNQ